MADIDTVARLLKECREYALEGTDFAEQFGLESLAATYNGLGSASFPEVLRNALTRLNPDLQCCIFLHDTRFAHGNCTRKDFSEANSQLRRNCKKVAVTKFRWYHTKRYWIRFKGLRYAELCQKFGWKAYLEGCRRHRRSFS